MLPFALEVFRVSRTTYTIFDQRLRSDYSKSIKLNRNTMVWHFAELLLFISETEGRLADFCVNRIFGPLK